MRISDLNLKYFLKNLLNSRKCVRCEKLFINISYFKLLLFFPFQGVRGIGEGQEDGPTDGAGSRICRREGEEPREYFTFFLQNLLHIFATDRSLLDDRGPFIIRYEFVFFLIYRVMRVNSATNTNTYNTNNEKLRKIFKLFSLPSRNYGFSSSLPLV